MKMARKPRIEIKPADKFGHWTVLSTGYHLEGKDNQLYCYCVCDCGTVSFLPGYKLTGGYSKSCGCCRSENQNYNHSHGCNHKRHRNGCLGGVSSTRLYRIWVGMKGRCYNPNEAGYKHYGARGITICDEWKDDFLAFREWALSNGYSDDLTIDRIEVDGDYSPDNCKWATYQEQENNRRNNALLTYDGKTQTVSQWARETGMRVCTLFNRIYDGWSVERALTEPVAPRHRHKSAV